jgi:hypothetical protein
MMRATLAAIAVLVGVAASPTLVARAESPECGGTAVIGSDDATGSGWCPGTQPGRVPSSGVDQRARWDEYCSLVAGRGFLDGDTVTFALTDIHGDSADEYGLMVSLGFDPTSIVGHYVGRCVGNGTDVTVGTLGTGAAIHFTISDPVPIDTLIDRAKARVPLSPPAVGLAPPADAMVVNVSTWLWVDNPWEPLTASETAGSVTVTVTARPSDVSWTFDDDQRTHDVTCEGPGEPWTRADGDDDSSCQFTFTRPSAWDADGLLTGTATITWEADWSLNDALQEPIGTLDRTTTFDIQVCEIQTVGGRRPAGNDEPTCLDAGF